MRRYFYLLALLAALAASWQTAQAQALNAAKLDSIHKATDSFLALAKDSYTSGKPPRYSDPAAKPLLDAVLNTKDIEGGKPLPWSAVPMLQDWNQSALKVGLVYYLAGTGMNDPVAVAKNPQAVQRANTNNVAFTPEFALYYDAQIRLHSAMIDAAMAQLAAATPEQKQDPAFRRTLNTISDNTARLMTGLIGTFIQPQLPSDWVLLRVVGLLDLTTKAAKFLAPEDRFQVKVAAVEAAGQIQNPDAKSGVDTIARAFELIR
jgi:hypothetical protein